MDFKVNIQFSSISIQSFKENALTTFFAQNRIVVVATVALAALAAAFYCLTRFVIPNEWLQFKSYFTLVKGELNYDVNRKGIAAHSERGTFRNGKLEGEGERSYLEILVQKGTFHKGELHGQGMLVTNDPHNQRNICPQHVKTEAKFENGRLNGHGKITFSDGTCYVGNFVHGILTQQLGNGQEKKIYMWGKIKEGFFNNDRLFKGKKIDHNRIYEGEFQDDQLHGTGKITDLGDNYFEEGTYEKGKLRKGKMVFENTILEGEFNSMGELHGQGKVIKDNKVIDKGIFENGKLKTS